MSNLRHSYERAQMRYPRFHHAGNDPEKDFGLVEPVSLTAKFLAELVVCTYDYGSNGRDDTIKFSTANKATEDRGTFLVSRSSCDVLRTICERIMIDHSPEDKVMLYRTTVNDLLPLCTPVRVRVTSDHYSLPADTYRGREVASDNSQNSLLISENLWRSFYKSCIPITKISDISTMTLERFLSVLCLVIQISSALLYDNKTYSK